MKKFLTLLLMLTVVLTLAACNKKKTDETTSTTAIPVPQVNRTPWPNEIWYEGFETYDNTSLKATWKLNDSTNFTDTTGAFIESGNASELDNAVKLVSFAGQDSKIETNFPDISKGLFTIDMKMAQFSEASFEIRTAADRVFSVNLMPDGRIAYRNNIGKDGERISTNVTYEVNTWVRLVVSWEANPQDVGYYQAFVYVGDELQRITPEGGVPFHHAALNGVPSKTKLRCNRPEEGMVDTPVCYFDNLELQDLSKQGLPTFVDAPTSTDPVELTGLTANKLVADTTDPTKGTFTLTGSANATNGNAKYIFVEAGSFAPTIDQVKAGVDYPSSTADVNVTILSSGEFAVDNQSLSHDFVLPDVNGEYEMYFVVTNPYGDSTLYKVEGIVSEIKVTTIAELHDALSNYPAREILIMNDLDGTDYTWELVTADFAGILNGQGYTIHNLTLNGSLIKEIDGGTFKNLNFANISYTGIPDTGYDGLLAQKSLGPVTIDNMTVTGLVMSVTTSKDTYAGGLIGRAYHNVTVNNLDITVSLDFTSTAKPYIGGVFGRTDAEEKGGTLSQFTNIKADVTITDSSMMDTDADGTLDTVSGKAVAGLIGRANRGSHIISNIILNVNLTGNDSVGGFIGILESAAYATVENVFVSGTINANTGKIAVFIANNKSVPTLTNISTSMTIEQLVVTDTAITVTELQPGLSTIVDKDGNAATIITASEAPFALDTTVSA